ncbi:MAG: hypothetical protein LBI28_11870 [Treponema sp.]|jgi:hypothetical protein|nr:hypothetical protein [Treponema sp.]
MKNKIIYLFVLALVLLCITGCATKRVVAPTAHPYSFAQDGDSGTATITFQSTPNKEGVDLHYFEGVELPIPERGQYWAPVTFPAGRPFTLIVNVYKAYTEIGKERTFNCPALNAGENYNLHLKVSGFLFIKNYSLVLTSTRTGVVYEQKIENWVEL